MFIVLFIKNHATLIYHIWNQKPTLFQKRRWKEEILKIFFEFREKTIVFSKFPKKKSEAQQKPY